MQESVHGVDITQLPRDLRWNSFQQYFRHMDDNKAVSLAWHAYRILEGPSPASPIHLEEIAAPVTQRQSYGHASHATMPHGPCANLACRTGLDHFQMCRGEADGCDSGLPLHNIFNPECTRQAGHGHRNPVRGIAPAALKEGCRQSSCKYYMNFDEFANEKYRRWRRLPTQSPKAIG